MFEDTLANETDFLRIVYYGNPGKGKTTAAAGLARLGKTLVYPYEPGLKKVALERQGIPTTNIVPRRGITSRNIEKEYWALRELDWDKRAELDLPVGAVFDTMTSWVGEERKMRAEVEYRKGKREAEAAGEEYKKPRNWLPQEAYGEMADELAPAIREFSDLPMHCAWLAHVRRDEDDDGEVNYSPAMTPGVQKLLIAYADVIMLMRQIGRYEDGRPVIIGTVADGGKHIHVKDRLGVVPAPHLVYPSMDRIISYMTGDLTEETDELQQEFLTWKDR